MMTPLLEHQTKAWLRSRGLPVPAGRIARTPDEVRTIAESLSGGCVVKALVPTGRRGKGGGVVIAADAAAAARAASAMFGKMVNGYPVSEVYIEEKVEIASELYLSLSIAGDRIKVLASREGGVDIEQIFALAPEKIVSATADALSGITRWGAIDLWSAAGLTGDPLRALGDLTVDLYDAFRAADAVTLELNPIAVSNEGRPSLAGAMMAIDESAMFRHPQWRDAATNSTATSVNAREQRVQAINAAAGGGEARYVELGGDIGLLVGGGGAGLYIHDLIVSMGGEPANHCVTPPTSADTTKLKAVIEAILDNPKTRGVLIGFNFAQMARADTRIKALTELLRQRAPCSDHLPIVVRLFGPGEDQARAMAAEFANITYLPRGTSLKDACRIVIEKTRAAT